MLQVEIAPRTIPTADPWHAVACEDGTLYLNGSTDPFVLEGTWLLEDLVAGKRRFGGLELLNDNGTGATLRREGLIAVKGFTKLSRYQDGEAGVSYLGMSVGVDEGLRMLEAEGAIPEELLVRDGQRFRYQAPRMYGMFVPTRESRRRALSVMALAEGEALRHSGLPRPTGRMMRRVLGRAAERAGLPQGCLRLGNRRQDELLFRQPDGVVRVTRVDIGDTRGSGRAVSK